MDAFNSLYENPRIYDIFFGDNITDDEARFYRALIDQYGDPVLEIGCGTGQFTAHLAREGVRVTGLDSARRMLDHARLKHAKLHFIEGDMRRFELSETFACIIIPRQSLQHILTIDDFLATFQTIQRHLRPDGVVAVQIFNPSLAILSREHGRRYPMSKPYYEDDETGEQYYAEVEIAYDKVNQISTSKIYYSTDPSEKPEAHFTLTLRQYFPQEIEVLLRWAGMEIIEKYGSFDQAPFDDRSMYQIFIMRKRLARSIEP